jgi:stage II sporulation protein R
MKKVFIGTVLLLILSLTQQMSENKKIIPDEAIRFRILANSNSEYDQNIKEKVSTELQKKMYSTLQNTDNIDSARIKIKSNLNAFATTVDNVLEEEKYNLGYKMDFGIHYFPDKKYKGLEYEEGDYESLLVQLGDGRGDNWWCVLFPPLCLLEAEESTEVEYKFFVQELIDKYF